MKEQEIRAVLSELEFGDLLETCLDEDDAIYIIKELLQLREYKKEAQKTLNKALKKVTELNLRNKELEAENKEYHNKLEEHQKLIDTIIPYIIDDDDTQRELVLKLDEWGLMNLFQHLSQTRTPPKEKEVSECDGCAYQYENCAHWDIKTQTCRMNQ